MMKMTLNDYQALPYSRRVERIHEDDGSFYWVAWIHELDGCKTDGDTQAKAMLNLNIAFDDYIEAMIEFGNNIPTPEKCLLDINRSSDTVVDVVTQMHSSIRELLKEDKIRSTQEEFDRTKERPLDHCLNPTTEHKNRLVPA